MRRDRRIGENERDGVEGRDQIERKSTVKDRGQKLVIERKRGVVERVLPLFVYLNIMKDYMNT